jgi:hypothetical protein
MVAIRAVAREVPVLKPADVRFGSKADIEVECAPNGGHLAGMELTKAAGLSEDESHGQTTFP